MNKTNFSKYLEQRDPELYEQMLNEGWFGDTVGRAKKIAGNVVGGVNAGAQGLLSAGWKATKDLTNTAVSSMDAAADTLDNDYFDKTNKEDRTTGKFLKAGAKSFGSFAKTGIEGLGNTIKNTFKTGVASARNSYANRDIDRAKELMYHASDDRLKEIIRGYLDLKSAQAAKA
jgi:hypothetical protein